VQVLDEVGVTITDQILIREIASENGCLNLNEADHHQVKEAALAI
jgi:hypothetical protein